MHLGILHRHQLLRSCAPGAHYNPIQPRIPLQIQKLYLKMGKRKKNKVEANNSRPLDLCPTNRTLRETANKQEAYSYEA